MGKINSSTTLSTCQIITITCTCRATTRQSSTAMNKSHGLSCIALIALLYPLFACTKDRGDETIDPCSSFISLLLMQPEQEVMNFDLEKSLLLTPDSLTAAYDSINPIESKCAPGSIQPSPPEDVMSPWETHSYLDYSAGTTDGIPWIQFVYPSIAESGPGISSSIVFYDDNGRAISTRLVSEYHSWESASTLHSVMQSGKITSCRQTIEFFSYDDDGNITEELPSPLKSECEHAASTYP